MKCLIVAAGQGARLREKAELKPMVSLLGRPLIEHVIDRGRLAGIDTFLVVNGYRGDELRLELDRLSLQKNVSITHIVNDEWTRSNGVSLLKGKPYLDEPFLLTMCDHLVDPRILQDLVSASIEPESVTLAVDFNVHSLLNDPEDVTRVSCVGNRIERIGKMLKDFNAFDTGVFLCSPVIFDALEASQAQGDDTISGAMNVLADWKKAFTFDVGDKLWIDIDDPAAFQKAEDLLSEGRL